MKNNYQEDIRIENNNYNFHIRVVAVIRENNKYLIQQIDGYKYYVLPGGHTHLGESSIQAIKREIKEELECDIKETKLFCIHENFYPKNNKIEHWIEFYFKVKLKDKLNNKDWDITENDNGKIITSHFIWVTNEELKELDLKPSTIKELLINNKIDEFNYLIDEIK